MMYYVVDIERGYDVRRLVTESPTAAIKYIVEEENTSSAKEFSLRIEKVPGLYGDPPGLVDGTGKNGEDGA